MRFGQITNLYKLASTHLEYGKSRTFHSLNEQLEHIGFAIELSKYDQQQQKKR